MSYENKGSLGYTITVSREPDRSGNIICNGTNDHIEINAAITLVNSFGGGTVMILEGTYNLGATITGLDYVTIRGQGRGTLLYVPNSTFINAMTFDTKAYWAVMDLRIDGNYANNADQGTDLNQNCIYVIGGAENHAMIQNCWLINPRRNCYYSAAFTNSVIIVGNQLDGARNSGIFSIGHHSPIVGNVVYNCVNYGIGGVDDAGCVGNMIYNCTRAIWLNYDGATAVGNAILQCGYGISAAGNPEIAIVGNSMSNLASYGVYANGDYATIVGNVIDVGEGGGRGMYFSSADYCVCSSNVILDATGENVDGIWVNDSTKNIFSHNSIYNCGRDGIRLEGDSDNNVIFSNFIDTTVGYGINISAGTCNLNLTRENRFFNCTSGMLNDVSGDTIMHTLHVPFLEPIGTAAWDVSPPSGIEVDAADEGAFTMGVLPLECQETHRVKIWAVGLAAPGVGNQMEITLGMDAGQPDEAYNAEAIAVANKDSDQTNFAVNDIVTWTFTSADDSDIGDLVGEDCFEIRAMFVAGGAPDIDTDVLFRCVEIHYV